MKRLNYEVKQRTLEEVAELLDVTLEFKRLRGKKYVWQVKLGKVYMYPPEAKSEVEERAVCKESNPNFALRRLCKKLSYKTVIAPQVKGETVIMTLGEIVYGSLYLRLDKETSQ